MARRPRPVASLDQRVQLGQVDADHPRRLVRLPPQRGRKPDAMMLDAPRAQMLSLKWRVEAKLDPMLRDGAEIDTGGLLTAPVARQLGEFVEASHPAPPRRCGIENTAPFPVDDEPVTPDLRVGVDEPVARARRWSRTSAQTNLCVRPIWSRGQPRRATYVTEVVTPSRSATSGLVRTSLACHIDEGEAVMSPPQSQNSTSSTSFCASSVSRANCGFGVASCGVDIWWSTCPPVGGVRVSTLVSGLTMRV